ncbi:hypothetical protein EB796_017412 [Bugula neritina]|uniref:Uncharacterized protein n=1 Tax=Bugula neritina TaxID=10212 RepID=A0A7J7JF99_BUGNE|nr:hypothetical protein EB796_017412 [Bugula neritina]
MGDVEDCAKSSGDSPTSSDTEMREVKENGTNLPHCLAPPGKGVIATASSLSLANLDIAEMLNDSDPRNQFDEMCDPENPKVGTFQQVSAAAYKIKSGVLRTPCTRSGLSRMYGMDIWFKKEFDQFTGSFKERGPAMFY